MRWSTRSISISRLPVDAGSRPVVRPRAETARVTFHQWLRRGVRPSLVLPTIWDHRWRVFFAGRQGSKSSGGSVEVTKAEPTTAGQTWLGGARVDEVARPSLDPG